MSNNTGLSKKNKSDSAENAATRETLGKGLFSSRTDGLLLLGGLFFLLCNVVMFLGVDFRPSAWLYYFDMRYWSSYFSMLLWIAAIWLIAESIDMVEDYLPSIRVSMAVGILLVLVFALRSSFNTVSLDPNAHSIWLNVVIIIAVCCAVRSLFLLYDYHYEGGENIDMEEAVWFWGLSGFLFAILLILGFMSLISVKTQLYAGTEGAITESLFTNCFRSLQEMLRTGTGTFALQMFGVFILVTSVAFVYVAGKWALIFLSKMREE